MRCFLLVFVACSILLLALACSSDSTGDPPCAPAPSVESWPVDPTALTPRPWPADAAFTPAPHAPFPSVPDTGDGHLATLRLVSLVTAGDPLRGALFAFGDALVKSAWLASFASEYGLAPIGTSLHIDGPALTGNVTLDDMRAYVLGNVASAPPDGKTLYMLYLPPDAMLQLDGALNCGCNAEGGAHASLQGSGDAIAYVQRCSASDDDQVMRTASHEVAEAMTDTGKGYRIDQPSPAWSGTVWASAQPGGAIEIGDLCSGTFVTEGKWTYQRIWSNAAAAAGGDPCVPALATPWFDTSVDEGWVTVAAGSTASVRFRAWSTGPRDDWYVYPLVAYPPSSGFSAQLVTGEQQELDGVVYSAVNDGAEGTLTVSVAPGTRSGSYAVVRIVSRAADRVDGTHFWPVGFRVP
jgi:hypothetical protein